MAEFIVVSRNPSNKRILFVSDEEGEPMVFQSESEAESAGHTAPICRAWGYSIIELEGV